MPNNSRTRSVHGRNTVRYYLIMTAFILFLFFSNDFGLIDIQKTAIIMAAGIDRKEEGFLVTAQIAIPQASKQGEQAQAVQIQSEGDTIAEALNQINVKTGWYPKLTFCNLIVIGEDAAKRNVFQILDFFLRDDYMSDSCLVATCVGSAKDLLETQTPVDPMSSVAMQKVLSAHAKRLGTAAPVSLRQFAMGYFGTAKSGFLPVIKAEPQLKDKKQGKDTQNSQNRQGEQEKQGEREKQKKQSKQKKRSGGKSVRYLPAPSVLSKLPKIPKIPKVPKVPRLPEKPVPPILPILPTAAKGGGEESGSGGGGGESGGGQGAAKGANEEQMVFSAEETALFADGVQVDKLTPEETFALCLIKEKLKLASYTLESEGCNYTLNIKQSKSSMKLNVDDNSMARLKINVLLTAGIKDASVSQTITEITNGYDVPKEIFEEAKKKLKKEIENVFEKSRRHNCDVFEVTDRLQKFERNYFSAFRDDILQRLILSVNVKLESLR